MTEEQFKQCIQNIDELIALNVHYNSLLEKQKLGIEQRYNKERDNECRIRSNSKT